MPEQSSSTEPRHVVCLECEDRLIIHGSNISDDEAREIAHQHYQRRDLTHSVSPSIALADLVFVRSSVHELGGSFPDSLLICVRNA